VFKVGITGGIGSGKTSVCKVFEILKIPVFSADKVASVIMASDKSVIDGINAIADKNIYPGGILDRKELSALIFNNRLKLAEVNNLVHPAVFKAFRSWVNSQSAPYVIMEAAILFESGASKMVDRIITVNAPEEERIQRIIHRSGLSRDQVTERIKNQIDDATRSQQSDYIISNAENDMIIPAILKIHNDILRIIN
jgi:dephospho-CoA kinase